MALKLVFSFSCLYFLILCLYKKRCILLIIEYKLAKNDYYKATKLFTRRYTRSGKKTILISYFVGFFLLLTSLFMLSSIGIQFFKFKQNYSSIAVNKSLENLFFKHYTYFIIILVYLLLGGFFLYIATTYPDLKTRKWANNVENSRAFTLKEVSFSDTGLSCKDIGLPINEKIWKWSDFRNFYETSEYLLLEISNKEIFILPKSLLNRNESEYVKALILKHIVNV